MDVLATRTLKYRQDSGKETDVTLTVFVPFLMERGDWKCQFKFSPPDSQRPVHVYGMGFVQALLSCLSVARGYIEHPTEERTSWQGMMHSGLPWHHEKPVGYQPPPIPAAEVNPWNLEILTEVRLGMPHGDNDVRELILIVYRPFAADETQWKCAFAFGEGVHEPVRYGVGEDFIEALLDALALARVTYETMIPGAWEPPESDEFDTVQFWPHKIGREYFTEPSRYSNPDMPDFSASSLQDGT